MSDNGDPRGTAAGCAFWVVLALGIAAAVLMYLGWRQ